MHPMHLVDAEVLIAVELAHALEGGGLGGGGPLPEPGGYLDQAAATMASLAQLSGAFAKIREHKRKRKRT